MSVELRAGRYAYDKRRVGGRVVSEYVGRGMLAVVAAERDREDRERREAGRRAWHAKRKRYESAERRIVEWFRGVEALAVAALEAGGYHRHKRTWRRRRAMNEIARADAPKPPATVTPGASISPQEELALLKKVAAGDRAALPALTDAFRSAARGERDATIYDMAGNPAEQLRVAMLGVVNGGCEGSRIAGRVRLEQVQRDLEGPDPSPMERLLAERAATCWFLVYQYEADHARRILKGISHSEGDFIQRRIDRAHRRFLSACRTLATVRKLALPSVLLAVGGLQQINVAGKGSRPPQGEMGRGDGGRDGE